MGAVLIGPTTKTTTTTKVNQTHYRPGQGLKGSTMLKLQDFKTVGT
jgi:hypothetical protein